MPKRRLGYGEVAITKEPVSAPPPAKRQADKSSSLKRSSSRRKISDVLVKLSRSCNSHSTNCHKDRKGAVRVDDEETRIPDQCRSDLEMLRNLLPEIEKKFRPPARGERGPEAHDVAHLCDFYNSVMQGNYCPYAPHLFHMGKSVNEVMLRVHFLLRHLVSPAVVAAAEKEAVYSDTCQATSPPVLRTLSHTIAHLLSFLVDTSIHACIFSDLVMLLEDCSFLFEDKSLLPVKLSLFENTRERASLEMDFCLDIHQPDQVWTLQTAVFMAMQIFIKDLNTKGVHCQFGMRQEAAKAGGVLLPSGLVDLQVPISDHGTRNEMVSVIIGSIRSVVLMEDPSQLNECLHHQGKLAAAKMLREIVGDWSRLAPTRSSRVECEILVADAIGTSLKSSVEVPSEYLDLLGELLRLVVIETPSGQPFGTDAFPVEGQETLRILLDCIATISWKDAGSRGSLDAIVLMSVHLLLHLNKAGASTTSYCLSNGLIPCLLALLEDSRYSTSAAAILSQLLLGIAKPKDFNAVCQAATDANQESVGSKKHSETWEVEIGRQADSKVLGASELLEASGSKRKRQSTKPSTTARSPIRALELSPSKRIASKIGIPRNANSQAWIVAFKEFLQSSLDHARHLTYGIATLEGEKQSVKIEKVHGDIAEKLPKIGSALLLITILVSKHLTDDVEASSIAAACAAGQQLVEAVERVCKMLMDNASGYSDISSCQIIVDCALNIHYIAGNLLCAPQHSFLRKSLGMVLAATNLAHKLILEGDSFVVASIHSFPEYDPAPRFAFKQPIHSEGAQPESIGLLTAWKDSFSRRFASLTMRGGYNDFLKIAPLEMIHAMPFGHRSCLLWSLYPQGILLGDTLPLSRDAGSAQLPFADLIARNPIGTSSLVHTILLFVPRYVASYCSLSSEEGKGAELSALLLKFLVEFINPLAGSVSHSDNLLCTPLLLAAVKLEAIATSEKGVASDLRHSAFSTISEISIATAVKLPTLGCDATAPCLEVDIELKKCSRAIASNILENHPDPYVRKLRWYLMAKSALRSSRTEIREQMGEHVDPLGEDAPTSTRGPVDPPSKSSLLWLIEAPFLDDDHRFREEASSGLRSIILSENDSFLLSHFCSDEDYQTLKSGSKLDFSSSSQQNYDLEHAAERVVSEFFRTVDKLLHTSIGVSDSQLSFTLANSGEASGREQRSQPDKLSRGRTAVKLLASFCASARNGAFADKFFFQKAFQRLVRIWAAETLARADDLSFSPCKALTFAGLSGIATAREHGRNAWWLQSRQFAATVISDILVLTSNASREVQFLQLEGFIRAATARDRAESITNSRTLKLSRDFVEEMLPAIIAQFIEDKSMELLGLTRPFLQFLEERIGRIGKQPNGKPITIGGSNAPDRWRYRSTHSTLKARDKHIAALFQDNKIIDGVLPLVFMRLDRSGLSFFTKEVLKGVTLNSLMKNRDRSILKGLAWELGREPETIGPARVAIRAAAVARNLDKVSSSTDVEARRGPVAEVEVGKVWVTSHFMYLLVSVVQFRWKTRRLSDRLHSVRCLHSLLDFLVANEVPQYFATIMATINASILDSDSGSITNHQDMCDASALRLYAVKSLSKMIRLVADIQFNTIASSLTAIVVALIPVLDDQSHEGTPTYPGEEARDVAVSLLEFLTAGDLGRKLANSFNEVPFLPVSQSLENVHRSLRLNGVDFDNLEVLTSTAQHAAAVGQGFSTVEVSATMASAVSTDYDKIPALQKRLGLVCALLDNESTNVRKVVLQHLTDLLRANRETYLGLIRAEGSMAGRRVLTVEFKDVNGGPKWASRGAVTTMMERLLARCVAESDDEVRLWLATCIGEVGAISETRLGEIKIGSSMGDEAIDSPTSSYRWRLDQAPWQSQPVKYELQLVTRHLVVALKAAPSSTDQHKVAFSIQQLLHFLNAHGRQSEPANMGASEPVKMTKWLKEKLTESGELELIEPYFSSDFQEKNTEGYSEKWPPFFKVSAGYFTWMSNFCRWMIHGSRKSDPSPWRDMLFACRTAIRTESGLNVAEFILPLLVLDRMCYGTGEEFLLIRQELTDVLTMETKVFMDAGDRKRAVNVVFTTIDTLRAWADREVEERSKGRSLVNAPSRSRRQASNKIADKAVPPSWSAAESIDKISDLLKGLNLRLQAKAAQAFGMNARALQRLELEAREASTLHIFEKSKEEQKKDAAKGTVLSYHTFSLPLDDSFDIELMKEVLSRLDDCETMAAIGKDSLFFNPLQRIRDSIRASEASEDYEAAVQEYERAIQASNPSDRDPSLVQGSLRCLMELGRYESVLNQAGGWRRAGHRDYISETSPFAIEAAWKLGRWQTLSDLLDEEAKASSPNAVGDYEVHKGKAVLGLFTRDRSSVVSAIRCARDTVIQNLSSMAAESYARSYSDIICLQSLREIENANDLSSFGEHNRRHELYEIAHSTAVDGWSWKGRVDAVTSRGALSIISTRVALARLHADPVLVGSLFLEGGHRARKNKQWAISENLLSQAQATMSKLDVGINTEDQKLFHLVYSSQVQLAKLKYAKGEFSSALRMLGQPSVDQAVAGMLQNFDNSDAVSALAVDCEKCLIQEFSGMPASMYENDARLMIRFAGRLLQLTRWVSEIGLEGGSDVLQRFRLIHKLAPEWEKGHFYFGKFVDSMLQARIAAIVGGSLGRDSFNGVDENEIRSRILLRDQTCQSHTLLAMQRYAATLKLGTKHVYQALPRLLSLWFDLVSVGRDQSKEQELDNLRSSQNEANKFMANQIKRIPSVAFYTAMPQLISRVVNVDPDASMIVKTILHRVLSKFPQQAMWPLAWLQGSQFEDRKLIGNEIFNDAQKTLAKHHKSMSNLVGASKSLFQFLRELAVKQGPPERPNANRLDEPPWQDPNVDLSEFVPPIQAALTATPTSSDHPHSKDHFSRTIPRMRAFSHRVGVMSSKAKPKKLKAFAVPGSYKAPPRLQRTSTALTRMHTQDVDIGELHFLVKQEAKGDLRKDARVQDLNNVINRLMASNNGESSASSRRRRRLHLRTFAVTCLSEDIGILEWVPDTDSLRNLVTSSYNPQTSPGCSRRRGNRMTNFGDVTLRSHYEMCQNKFFKDGNLPSAASLFEDHCLRPCPPVLYWWFIQKFHDPHGWYEARNRFTLSTAAWSAVGHVIGLGDRHSENILVDTSTGECVHVDFDCIFDKGLNLPKPEIVPFRLTANMVDAFGPTGTDGVYTTGMQTAMRTLRDNRDTLLSVLEPFLKDPVIDWKRHRGQQNKSVSGTTAQAAAQPIHTEKEAKEAKRSIKVIEERLQGIYNLRNPNLKKYSRIHRSASQDDDISHLVPLPVEGQVQRMIKEATSHENLVQLYIGWMPWV